MEFLRFEELTPEELDKKGKAKIYVVLLKIDDLEERAKTIVETASNLTWLAEIDPVDIKSYEARAIKTIDFIVNEIVGGTDLTRIGADFGEYMISYTALDCLVEKLNHKAVPLAEIFKEKLSGNPGFDFHTETHNTFVGFGEAKYSANSDAQGRALKQIGDFIKQKKDHSETIYLKSFVSTKAIESLVYSDERSFIAAFSVNSDDPHSAISSALKSSLLDPLLKHMEVYIVGVTLK